MDIKDRSSCPSDFSPVGSYQDRMTWNEVQFHILTCTAGPLMDHLENLMAKVIQASKQEGSEPMPNCGLRHGGEVDLVERFTFSGWLDRYFREWLVHLSSGKASE